MSFIGRFIPTTPRPSNVEFSRDAAEREIARLGADLAEMRREANRLREERDRLREALEAERAAGEAELQYAATPASDPKCNARWAEAQFARETADKLRAEALKS